MFKKKKIILSFDYELFFGDKSGTVQKSLIEPTNELLDALDSVGFKGNFFVDYLMLKYLKKTNTERTQADYKLILDQLKTMIYRGHRIELHIHPHWVDAKYNGDGTWDFSEFHHYSLNNFSEEEIEEMFIEGTNILNQIAREVNPDYKVVAFRAGGWAIQPFTKLKKGFNKAGLIIDSSPCKGFLINELHSFCDFRNLPDKEKYHFEDDICKEEERGQFLCIPITMYYRHIIQGLIEKFYKVFTEKLAVVTDGTHVRKEDIDAIKEGRLHRHSHPFRMLSLYTHPYAIPFMIWQLRKKKLLCLIQHPKDQTAVTIKVLKRLKYFFNSLSYIDFVK